MTKKINVAGMNELVSRAVAQSMQVRKQTSSKQASSQFSPDSDSDGERTGTKEPKVNPKLQNTGEGYEQASVSEFGLQAQQDLIRNQVDVSIPDKGAEPDTRNALDILPADGVQDCTMSPGDPTMKVTDPQTAASEPAISEKLQLKKDAAAIVAEVKEAHAIGQKIIDLLLSMTVNKQASASEGASQTPMYTQNDLFQDAAKMAAADSTLQIKEAWLQLVDEALYAADVVTANLIEAHKAQEKRASAAPQTPPQPTTSGQQTPAPKVAGDVVDPAAAEAMQQPMMDGGMPQGEAEALLAQSMAEQGLPIGAPPAEVPLTEVPPTGEATTEIPTGETPADAASAEGTAEEIVPPELLQVMEILEQQGFSVDEIIDAAETVLAEQDAGIDPAAGAVADEEAEKTGHYKFASFIGRPRNKTAEQEQRAARARRAMRDQIKGPVANGPNVKDFN